MEIASHVCIISVLLHQQFLYEHFDLVFSYSHLKKISSFACLEQYEMFNYFRFAQSFVSRNQPQHKLHDIYSYCMHGGLRSAQHQMEIISNVFYQTMSRIQIQVLGVGTPEMEEVY